jgi:hypothetical protein
MYNTAQVDVYDDVPWAVFLVVHPLVVFAHHPSIVVVVLRYWTKRQLRNNISDPYLWLMSMLRYVSRQLEDQTGPQQMPGSQLQRQQRCCNCCCHFPRMFWVSQRVSRKMKKPLLQPALKLKFLEQEYQTADGQILDMDVNYSNWVVISRDLVTKKCVSKKKQRKKKHNSSLLQNQSLFARTLVPNCQ